MGNKRSNGEGTTYKNEKRQCYEGQFSYNDPVTGELKRKKFTGKTDKEVKAKGKAFLQGIENGLLPDAGKITVWQWLDRWLTDYIKPNVRIKSFEKYENCLKNYVKPKIGDKLLIKIKAPDIQRLFNEMLVTGGVKGVGVSTSTVRGTRRYLSMAFDKGIEVGVLSKNVIKSTTPPKLSKEEIKPLKKEQADKLLQVAKEGEYMYIGVKQRRKPSPSSEYHKGMCYVAVLLALSTGMRLGEVFGLKWNDIDFVNNSISVNRALVSSSTQGMIFEDPKTKGSKRKIPVTQNVRKALEKYKKEQEWFVNLMGDKYDDKQNLVMANLFGKPIDTSNFTTRYFKKMLEQAQLDRSFKFHDLRHTHATLLLCQGINIKVISERLGHSTITMTLDTYSHLMPDMQATAVRALKGIFNIG